MSAATAIAAVRRRPAEKARVSTCEFGDRVAKLVSRQISSSPKLSPDSFQSCVSSVVAHSREEDSLTVLSLGCGTKFLAAVVEEGGCDWGGDAALRDMHAEVLAVRAFRRYCYEGMLKSSRRHSAACGHGDDDDDEEEEEEEEEAEEEEEHGEGGEEPARFSKFFKTIKKGGGKKLWALRSGITLHLYCSSAPCGDSTVRRWAASKKDFGDGTESSTWPTANHQPLNAMAMAQGQFALLCKGSVMEGEESILMPVGGQSRVSDHLQKSVCAYVCVCVCVCVRERRINDW